MSLGHNRERQVKDWLTERDWVVIRAAGSLGCVDLVALKAGEPSRLIEVKATARGPYHGFPPTDRADLSICAQWAGAEAWLAWHPPRGKLQWIPESSWPTVTARPSIEERFGRLTVTEELAPRGVVRSPSADWLGHLGPRSPQPHRDDRVNHHRHLTTPQGLPDKAPPANPERSHPAT